MVDFIRSVFTSALAGGVPAAGFLPDNQPGPRRGGDYNRRRQYNGLRNTNMSNQNRMEEFMGEPDPPKASGTNRGYKTGIARPKWPTTVRPYTTRTRQHIVGNRPTGILDNKYDKDIVGSHPVPPFLSPHAVAGQRGTSAITRNIPAFQPGPHHLLFKG
jgi:hypothetical protein